VHCSRVSRSSAPSSIPPREHGQEDGRVSRPLTMLVAELVRRVGGSPSGRWQFRASDLDGVLILAQAALAALGPVRCESGHITF
jgi:hypothetical protein